MAAFVTWDNLRFSVLTQMTTDAGGGIHVPFTPAFPSVCHGMTLSLDDSGGTRGWLLGMQALTNIGFTANIADANGNPVVGVTLGIHWMAFGE